MVLVYLMHTQLEATLSFLEWIPDVSGQSDQAGTSAGSPPWCLCCRSGPPCHLSFFDKFETRMSLLAMADLLSHYLATGDKYVVAIETVSKVKPSEGLNIWCSEV